MELSLQIFRSLWKECRVTISASIQYPNKLFVKIDVDPISSTELIDHFEFYVDDVAQKVHLNATDVNFSAEGFAGGEQYEIYILAYPKLTLEDVQPIPSNKRVRREKKRRDVFDRICLEGFRDPTRNPKWSSITQSGRVQRSIDDLSDVGTYR